jgi:cell wall-associated NlpC family hydrolase
MKPIARISLLLCMPLAAALVAGCAGAPARAPAGAAAQRVEAALGQRILATALGQLGQPYRYGGNGPDAFDCSGLVRFAHAAQGVAVPRTTDGQFQAARPVSPGRIEAGDVLFFRFEGPKVSHVAIYAGDGRFVHAPQSGRTVEIRPLDDWYRRRLVGAGRLYE